MAGREAKDVVAMVIALFVESRFRFKEGTVFKSGKFDVIKGRGECNLHNRVWSPSADNRITVSCDAAIKSYPMDMAATAFVARDKRCIPLFAGVCWGYKFKRRNAQLEGECVRLWTTYLSQEKSLTDLRVETDLEGLPDLLKFGIREKDVSENLHWSFLSDFKATIVKKYKISFGSVDGSLNLVAHHLSQIGCFYQFLDKRSDMNGKVWAFRKDLKSVAPNKIKVLKDLTSYEEVDIVEHTAPRELKIILTLDLVKRHLIPVHIIENKVPKEVVDIFIPKFNCSDEVGQFFLGLIEDIGQGIADEVLESIVIQIWSKMLVAPVDELEITLSYGSHGDGLDQKLYESFKALRLFWKRHSRTLGKGLDKFMVNDKETGVFKKLLIEKRENMKKGFDSCTKIYLEKDFEKDSEKDSLKDCGYIRILGKYSPKDRSKDAIEYYHLEDLLTAERFQVMGPINVLEIDSFKFDQTNLRFLTNAMEVKQKAFSKFLNYGDELFENEDTDDTSDEVFIKMRDEWESFKLGLAKKRG